MFSNVRNFLEWCHYSDRSKSAVICFFTCLFFLWFCRKSVQSITVFSGIFVEEFSDSVNSRWQSTSTPPRPACKELSLMLKKEPESVKGKTNSRESYFSHQHFEICFSAVSSRQTRPSYLFCPGEKGREKVWRKGPRKNFNGKLENSGQKRQ